MALPTLTYNASSGSDTLASGAGPSTAVTGTNGDVTSGGTTLTLNTTKDFTGAANDGSDVLWYEGATTDRHLFRISSFTGGVATCTAIVIQGSTFSATRTAKNWAVGGKRKTFENSKDGGFRKSLLSLGHVREDDVQIEIDGPSETVLQITASGKKALKANSNGKLPPLRD